MLCEQLLELQTTQWLTLPGNAGIAHVGGRNGDQKPQSDQNTQGSLVCKDWDQERDKQHLPLSSEVSVTNRSRIPSNFSPGITSLLSLPG